MRSKSIFISVIVCVMSSSLYAFEVISIPNAGIIDNTTKPSLYDGTIAWDDGTYNGNLFYWDGENTSIVGNGSFAAMISLYNGKIAYGHNEGVNNGVRLYYWDGDTTTNVSGNLWLNGGKVSLFEGKVAYTGYDGSNNYLYMWDGTDNIIIDEGGFNPSMYDGNIAYMKGGSLYYWDKNNSTQIANSVLSDSISLYDCCIAFAASDGSDKEIYYWNGSYVEQITDNDIDDYEPSLFNGQVAWVGQNGTSEDTEIFFWDGTTIEQITDHVGADIHPSLYGNDIAWFRGKGWDGTGEIMYASDVPEPSTPPVADADGPYSIYVGDGLTLDASGSVDEDNDITSYMWNLDDDDDSTFETDAGGQAIYDVNYSYLQSLGLLINYTYTIGLKVTDSEGQSDVNDSTLTIVPKPATVVAVDIKPGSCPNPVNVKSKGVLPVAILGTADYDITTIDVASIRLSGVEPLRSGYEDVDRPVSDSNDCNCTTDGPDGFLDLTLKFETQRIVEAVGDVNDGDVRVLTLTGVLFDPMPFETPIEGTDCILIKGRHRFRNKADINKDGVVNSIDFAIIAENWLRASIVEE